MVGEQLRLRGIEVKIDLGNEIPRVHGEAGQLEQVFINLITNARDAIIFLEKNRQGRIEILTRSLSEGKIVEVTVRDNGGGIDAKNMEKIFDPFFSTKDVGKGTGLGLSISYGIIKKHGGNICVKNTGARGSVFIVELPAMENKNK